MQKRFVGASEVTVEVKVLVGVRVCPHLRLEVTFARCVLCSEWTLLSAASCFCFSIVRFWAAK